MWHLASLPFTSHPNSVIWSLSMEWGLSVLVTLLCTSEYPSGSYPPPVQVLVYLWLSCVLWSIPVDPPPIQSTWHQLHTQVPGCSHPSSCVAGLREHLCSGSGRGYCWRQKTSNGGMQKSFLARWVPNSELEEFPSRTRPLQNLPPYHQS